MGYDYHVRTAPRDELVAELRQLGDDRGSQGKLERRDEAYQAAARLEAGGDAVDFNRVLYAVDEDRGRWSAFVGTRDEVERELREGAVGFLHLGSPDTAAQAQYALERVERGEEMVRVGSLVYAVRV